MISAWLLSLWGASIRGGAVLIVAWVLCHLPRVPALFRCWIWRAAYAALLISLVWTNPVNLPLLRPKVVYQLSNPIQVDDPPPAAILQCAPIALQSVPHHAASVIAKPWYSAWPTIPFSLWLIFFVIYAGRLATGWVKARRLRDGPLLELSELLELCRAMNIQHPPAVRTHPAVAGPLLVGVRNPVIVLPKSMVHSNHLRLILAHELAHLQRKDLLWNWLPTLAVAVLPVHPLVWVCNRQWRLATEAACDAAAMETTNVEPADYGRVLVNVATTFPPRTLGVLAVAAVAESRWLLKQRLAAMANITHWNRRRSMIAGLMVGVFAMAAVVPWRVVAQEAAAAPAIPTTPTTRPLAVVDPAKPTEKPARKIPSFKVGGTIVITTNTLRASVAGTVTKVPVTVGQSVKHGDVLVQLDPTLAQAEVDQASAKNEYAEKDTANAEKLVLSNTVSAAELDLKKAQLQLSRVELKRAQYNLDATRVIAPFDGTVARCDVQVGDVVDSHQSMASVLQDGPPQVEFELGRGLAGRITVGTPVTVEVIGSGSQFKGAVSVVSPVVDANSQMQRVTAQLTDGRSELLAGMFVSVTVVPR